MTPSEKLIFDSCLARFFQLWTCYSPRIPSSNKELADIILYFGNTIIIISVKEIQFNNQSDNVHVQAERWNKRAVEKSVDQLYGAERILKIEKAFIDNEGNLIQIKNIEEIEFHRIAVAFGSKESLPVSSTDYGKGFVYVTTEVFLTVVLNELDTLSDFIQYLRDIKGNFEGDPKLMIGTQENMLAYYLLNARTMPSSERVIFSDDLYAGMLSNPAYQRKKEADKQSYVWDMIATQFITDAVEGALISKQKIREIEIPLRAMMSENRFFRRVLSNAYLEFLNLAIEKKIESRITVGGNGNGYVFLAKPGDYSREERFRELNMRCFVARVKVDNCKTIIGIATEAEIGKGRSHDLIYFTKEDLDDEDRTAAEKITQELGYFKNPNTKILSADEYPKK